jgi:hypothetical protein
MMRQFEDAALGYLGVFAMAYVVTIFLRHIRLGYYDRVHIGL